MLRLLRGRLGVVVIGVLVLAAMAGTAALLVSRRSGEDEPERTGPAAGQAAGTFFRTPALGVAGIRPPGWQLADRRQALRLRSRDRAALVAISAAPPSVTPRSLLESTLAALRRSYRGERVSRRRPAPLGGNAGIAASGTVTNARGVRLEFLVSTAKGRRRTYLLQVFVAREARLRYAEAQGLVNSLELSG